MKTLLIDLIWYHLSLIGMFHQKKQTFVEAKEVTGILPLYDFWLQESLRILAQENYIQFSKDEVVVLKEGHSLEAKTLWSQWEAKKTEWLKDLNLKAQAVLLDRTLHVLSDILVGRQMAQEIIFPDSSVALVESIYKHNEAANFFNQVLAESVMTHVKANIVSSPSRKVRILEIGAGTGATTAAVLSELKNQNLQQHIEEYCYTDLSKAFLNHAESSYGGDNPFLTYQILNVEKPITEITLGSFDIVIAANVLHATRNIKETVKHAKSLLKKQGIILLNEITVNSLFNHLTFGLLEGWWRYEDPELRVVGCPMLSPKNWQTVLEGSGFHSVEFPCIEALELGQQIIQAESDGVIDKQHNSSMAFIQSDLDQDSKNISVAHDSSEVASFIEKKLLEELSKSLRIDKNKVNSRTPFSSYGLDSIIAVNLTRTINQVLHIDLDITVMFERSTIEQLRDFILSQYQDQIAKEFGVTVKAVAVPNQEKQAKPILKTASTITSPPVRQDDLSKAEPIAIVGMSGTFPGAKDISQFWQNIEMGENCITSAPLERIDWQAYAKGTIPLDNKWGGFLEHVAEFDPLFFGISPKEAEYMSPEERLLIMCIWHTLENAGVTPKVLSQEPTGVFIATGPSDYQLTKAYPAQVEQPNVMSSPSLSFIPNRISYLFNLHGPSESCDTACSSSLVALHKAVRSIQQGECSQAIVGGVNLLLSPLSYLGLEAADMLSEDGQVRPFQDDANGFVKSEGVGALLLKPLSQAVKDNDHIHAVIRGTGIMHGGQGVSFTAPNIQGMKAAMLKAYEAAAIDPQTITYIEMQGVSSPLADAAEISAIKTGRSELIKAQRHDPEVSPICYLGNLKPCIGHGEIFAGMAALMKVICALQKQVIPAIPSFRQLNKEIDLEKYALQIAKKNMPWAVSQNQSTPRRASINGYGIGGVNAHVIVEEYLNAPYLERPKMASQPHIIILSAKNHERLLMKAEELLQFLHANEEVNLADMAYTLQIGREVMEARLALVVDSYDELCKGLQIFTSGDDSIIVKMTNFFMCKPGECRDDELLDLFAGQTGDILIKALITDAKFEKIASFWVRGINIDWQVFYENSQVKKISLPVYPFEQRTCWLSFPPIFLREVSKQSTQPVVEENALSTADKFVIEMVSSLLGLLPTEIDCSIPLEHYGLNSLLLLEMMRRLEARYPQYKLSMLNLNQSIEDVVKVLSSLEALQTESSHSVDMFPELVKLNQVTAGQPVFWIHGALGSVESYKKIAIKCRRPFYAIQARGFLSHHEPLQTLSEMAKHYIQIIKSVQPEGPYDLGGFCLGGILAYEMTRQLQQQSQTVSSVVMIDSPDDIGLKEIQSFQGDPVKNAALQVVNALLWPMGRVSMKKITDQLIHSSQLDLHGDAVSFIDQLARLAKKHGLAMRHVQIVDLIKQNVSIQIGYQIGSYEIQPLSKAREVRCYYFRNSRALFYGGLADYFKLPDAEFSLDNVNYSGNWQLYMPNFQMIDIDAPNHMTLLTHSRSVRDISLFCERLYSA